MRARAHLGPPPILSPSAQKRAQAASIETARAHRRAGLLGGRSGSADSRRQVGIRARIRFGGYIRGADHQENSELAAPNLPIARRRGEWADVFDLLGAIGAVRRKTDTAGGRLPKSTIGITSAIVS